MRRFAAGLLTLLWLALLPAASHAAEPLALPALGARVTDLSGTLDPAQRGQLEARLAEIDQSGKAQIAVLLLPTTQPETIEQFGIRLAEAWKIGHKGVDNGLIVIVAKDDRKMRIEVGYGLEGAIPDAIAKRIIAERMAPKFKQGDFFGGLSDAVDALAQAVDAPAATSPTGATKVSQAADGGGEHMDWMQYLFFLLVGAGVLRMIFGLFGSLAAAGLGGWLGFMIFGSLPMAVGAAVLVFLLSFVNMLSGGGGGSSGGSSSDSGGFSGGGGSFGGGGASGDW